jgi:hypothetical protein
MLVLRCSYSLPIFAFVLRFLGLSCCVFFVMPPCIDPPVTLNNQSTCTTMYWVFKYRHVSWYAAKQPSYETYHRIRQHFTSNSSDSRKYLYSYPMNTSPAPCAALLCTQRLFSKLHRYVCRWMAWVTHRAAYLFSEPLTCPGSSILVC